ncbi:hypothetical protein D3C87_1670310 [compost metagenome]
MPVGTQDVDHLPAGGNRCGDLTNLVVLVAQIGVDIGQKLGLRLEARGADRVLVAVIFLVGPLRGARIGTGITGGYRANGIRGAFQRCGAQVARMGVTDRLTRNRTQAKTLVGIE